jgi:hypothetical protein
MQRVLCVLFDGSPRYTKKCLEVLEALRIPYAVVDRSQVQEATGSYGLIIQFGLSPRAYAGFRFVDYVRGKCPALREVPYLVVGGHPRASINIQIGIGERNIYYFSRLKYDEADRPVEEFTQMILSIIEKTAAV